MENNETFRVPSEVRTSGEMESRLATFTPAADIFEDNESIRVYLNMPGVVPESVEINLEQNALTVEARFSPGELEGLQPLMLEYSGRLYRRAFTISDAIDKEKISATVKNGVVELVLPKAEEVKPKKIVVRTV